ncbi:hypothetical protein J3E68DRAFT_171558 [Trichoderma sp. SZMC 28012]
MSGALCVLSSCFVSPDLLLVIVCIKALFGVEHHSIGIAFATASLAIGTAGPHWPSPIAHHPSHPHARRLLLGLRGYLKGSSRGFGVKLQQTVIVLVIADKKSGGGRHHSPLQPNTSIHRQLCCALAYSYRQICFDAACVDDAAGKRTCNSTHFGLRRRSAEARNSSAPRRAEQKVALVKLAKIVSCPHPMVLGYDPCKSRPPPAYLEGTITIPIPSLPSSLLLPLCHPVSLYAPHPVSASALCVPGAVGAAIEI